MRPTLQGEHAKPLWGVVTHEAARKATHRTKKNGGGTNGCGSCEWGRKRTGTCAHWIATCMSSVMGHSPAVHAPAVSPISPISGGCGTLLQIAELGREKKKPFLCQTTTRQPPRTLPSPLQLHDCRLNMRQAYADVCCGLGKIRTSWGFATTRAKQRAWSQ